MNHQPREPLRISGHKTGAIVDPCNVVNEEDLKKHQSGLLRPKEEAQKKMEKQYGHNSDGWHQVRKEEEGKDLEK